MAEPVDRRGEHENVEDEMSHDHEDAPHRTKDPHRQDQPEDATKRSLGENPAIPPIRWDVLSPTRDSLRIPRFADVVVDVPELDLPEAVNERAMRVLFRISESVMLSVHGDPLATILSRGDPEDQPEEKIRDRMESQSAMRQTPVEIDRSRVHSRLGNDQRKADCNQHTEHGDHSFRTAG